jgi:hypothetical protein
VFGVDISVALALTAAPLAPAGFVLLRFVDPTQRFARRRRQLPRPDTNVIPTFSMLESLGFVLWTTPVVTVVAGIPPTVLAVAVHGDPFVDAAIFGLAAMPLVAILGWLAGAMVYALIGLVVFSSITVIQDYRARRKLDLRRFAIGLLLTLVGVLGTSTVLASPQLTGPMNRFLALEQLLYAFFTFDGPVVGWAWVSRVSLVAVIATAVWVVRLTRTRRRGKS